MPSIFSMDHVPAGKRFEYFQNFVEEYYVPVDVQCDTPERFNSWRKHVSLGQVDAGSSLLGEMRVTRTSEHISQSSDDRIKLIVPVSGAIAVTQDGNEAIVSPGEFYLTDPLRPSQERIIQDLEFNFVLLPRNEIVSHVADIENLTATGFPGDMPFGKLAMEYLRSLSNVLDEMHEHSGASAGAVAVDLFRMALWERTDRIRTNTTTYRRARFEQAKAFIDMHLTDTDLSLSKVAAAMGVSTRYVCELLAEGGMRYRDYVLERRLAGCERDLTNPLLANHSISDICFRWAFNSGAHFSRSFRNVYGMSPREYRALRA